ncbi:legumin type B-like [Lotus japonicus]|uniref:Legumin storage protein 2 n=1 Tax=Lotus japonicus TaxID=34305 RepID=B5U8K1_LOTJA|nr:legumin type B-like [Lotus japonicus]CAR78991.1 legumin storage protein 2 [Lotus japonicus]
MAKPFVLSLCLLLFTSTCLARSFDWSDRFSQCQLDRINVLEPDNRVESEAGLIETWSPSQSPELQCAGVSVVRRTIQPKGLHLPSFTPSPQLIMIVQGRGALGIAIPGCPETYEEPQSQSRQGRRGGSSRQQRDRHQKIRHFSPGDIIAIPPGIPYWTYNYGNEPAIAISLIDTSNFANQLDQTPRVFYLAGNPAIEHPETQQSQRQPRRESPGGRRHGQHHQESEQEEEEGGSILSGFGAEFLQQVFNIDHDTAKQLQSSDDQRRQIVKVEGDDLSFISPESADEDEDEEDEDEDQEQHGRHSRPSGRRTRRPSREEDEDEDEDEEERQGGGRGRGERQRHFEREEEEEREERGPRGRGKHWQREEEEEEEESRRTIPSRRESRGRGGCRTSNGLEENFCTLKIHENINRPSRADLYNPRAGRISDINSLTLPILRFLGLSAEYVNLYQNGIYGPHWNINANSIIYVVRGRGRVRIVNCQGQAVFNDELRKGQLLVVPQNFVVAQQAQDEGFEYVVFKTNARAAVSHVKQVFRATPAEVLSNAFGIRQRDISDLKFSGNWGPLVNPDNTQSRSRDSVIAKVA